MGYTGANIGTPDSSSGKIYVGSTPYSYSLQLNVFMSTQSFKQQHPKHKPKA
jgi:hypothetical protein